VDENEFEFDFFPEHPPDGDESQEVLWEDEPPDAPRRREAEAAPPHIVMRRRVAAIAAVALLLLIILIVVVTSGGSGHGSSYRGYLAGLAPVANGSAAVGASLSTALGGKQTASSRSALLTRLDGLVQQESGDIARLEALTPPSALRDEHAQALAALDLRLRGLQGIRNSLTQALAAADSTPWLPVLSSQLDDLITSDVIWESAVRGAGNAVLQANGLGTSAIPASQFVADATTLRKSIQTVLGTQGATSTGPVLKLGDTGADVTAWQTQLNAWLKATGSTLTPLTVDGAFGATTQTATEALQTASSLTPDGVVGPSTRQALQRALAGTKSSTTTPSTTPPPATPPAPTGPVLKLGDKGSDVTAWQTQLNQWLKATQPTATLLTVDGTFGTSTQTVTEALQSASGLTPDGIVGPSTRQALTAALSRSG